MNGTITTSVSDVMHSLLLKSRKKLFMASIMSNAYMAWQFSSERVVLEDGGYQISNPLIVGRNPNIAAFSYYESLPVGQTSEFTTVEYGWSRIGGTSIISGQEEDENRGSATIFKLAAAKLKVLDESIKERFSGYLYSIGGGTDPYGLPALIPDNPNTGTLGGLNRATQTQWRTSAYNFSGGIDSTNIEEVYDDVLMDLTLKNEKPSLILAGRNLWRMYRQAVRDKFTIPLSQGKSGKRMFDLGFSGMTHDNVTMLYDEMCPVDTAYFINDKYLTTHVLRHVNFRVEKLNSPWNMDASGSRVLWQGQNCLWLAHRKHGVVNN
jgi:hypothetical protein